MEEVEYIYGFDIEKRELTQEEKEREITIERMCNFHHDAGEDFLDTCAVGRTDVFAGFMAHKYIDRAKEIWDILNEEYSEIQSFKEFYQEEYNEEHNIDNIYFDYLEFINTTEYSKAEVNQILIQVDEYYNS
jgi:hypothetical protein